MLLNTTRYGSVSETACGGHVISGIQNNTDICVTRWCVREGSFLSEALDFQETNLKYLQGPRRTTDLLKHRIMTLVDFFEISVTIGQFLIIVVEPSNIQLLVPLTKLDQESIHLWFVLGLDS